MTTPAHDLPFADERRAAALLLHWLDGNEPGQKQILLEATDQDRTPHLIYAILDLIHSMFPTLPAKSPEICERLLSAAYTEVGEAMTASDDPTADDHVRRDNDLSWLSDTDPEPESD